MDEKGSTVAVLGGCGAVGNIAVRTLVKLPDYSKIIIADKDIEKVKNLAKEIGVNKVEVREFDANNVESILNIVSDIDIVLNCVGPFYKFGPTILSAIIDAGSNCVDICDDVDATIQLFSLHDDAKKKKSDCLDWQGKFSWFY